jgi:hypothetical protein
LLTPSSSGLNSGLPDYSDVVDGARSRHVMCHDGSVDKSIEEPSTMTTTSTIGFDIAKLQVPVTMHPIRARHP